MNQKFTTIRIRSQTKDAIEAVAKVKGWKIVEAIERATKAIAKQERIKLPNAEQSAA